MLVLVLAAVAVPRPTVAVVLWREANSVYLGDLERLHADTPIKEKLQSSGFQEQRGWQLFEPERGFELPPPLPLFLPLTNQVGVELSQQQLVSLKTLIQTERPWESLQHAVNALTTKTSSTGEGHPLRRVFVKVVETNVEPCGRGANQKRVKEVRMRYYALWSSDQSRGEFPIDMLAGAVGEIGREAEKGGVMYEIQKTDQRQRTKLDDSWTQVYYKAAMLCMKMCHDDDDGTYRPSRPA